MKKKQNGTPRRRRPEPNILESEQIILPQASCPHCNKKFSIESIEGSWFQRRCPVCAASISEQDFDTLAQELSLANKNLNNEKGILLEPLINMRRKESSLVCWWQVPFRKFLYFKQKRYKRKYDTLLSCIDATLSDQNKSLSKLAWERYYLSEWFLCTHILPKDGTNSNEVTYSIEPSYKLPQNEAVFVLVAKNKKASGVAGEFMVFEELRVAASRADSPLYGARILPNLYVLKDKNSAARDGSCWCQIDCVVLTEQCAFIVETKRWKRQILTDESFGHVYSSIEPADNSDPSIIHNDVSYKECNYVLGQNSRHTSYFYEVCSLYPFERLYELTVFVDPIAFEGTGEDFVDNIFVGMLEQGNNTIIRAMERTCTSLESIVTQAKLIESAEELLKQYGDLNQKRSRIHVERIRRQLKN